MRFKFLNMLWALTLQNLSLFFVVLMNLLKWLNLDLYQSTYKHAKSMNNYEFLMNVKEKQNGKNE